MSGAQKERILALDDHEEALFTLERLLRNNGYEVVTTTSGSKAVEIAHRESPSIILSDVNMPEMDGYQFTQLIKSDPQLRFTPVILLTARDSLEDIVHGLDRGADGYVVKPFKPEELLARVKAALRLKRVYEELRTSEARNSALIAELSSRYDASNIVGESSLMSNVHKLVSKVAKAESPVLITGPSGTGKELVARSIHAQSPRSDKAFIAKNCAAFSETLLESELFGHSKGAFTGAIKEKAGLFEAAHEGTLFLDEIGEMSPTLQAKMLRVLQDGTFIPVGKTDEIQVDVRVLAATNRELVKMIEEGTFREDLYYRLNVINIDLPPLAKRAGDVPLLVQHFLAQAASTRGVQPKEVSEDALGALSSYLWPGNVRELENEIERMMILGDEDEILGADLLSPRILHSNKSNASAAPAGSLKSAIEDVERQMIRDALDQTGWNKTNAAKTLGISRSNLITKVQQFGLEQEQG